MRPVSIPSISRQFRRVLCVVLAVWLCSAQLAVAMHACVQGAATSTPMQHPCADAVVPDLQDSANLCSEHCKQGKQGEQLRLPTAAPAVWRALYPLTAEPAFASMPRQRPRPDARVPTAPPHAIAHCVLRT